MTNFLEGLDGTEFGTNGRSMLPRQKRRELDREKAEIEGALEIHKAMLAAINKGTQYKLNGNALIDALAVNIARMSPLHEADTAQAMIARSVLINIADARFANDLQG